MRVKIFIFIEMILLLLTGCRDNRENLNNLSVGARVADAKLSDLYEIKLTNFKGECWGHNSILDSDCEYASELFLGYLCVKDDVIYEMSTNEKGKEVLMEIDHFPLTYEEREAFNEDIAFLNWRRVCAEEGFSDTYGVSGDEKEDVEKGIFRDDFYHNFLTVNDNQCEYLLYPETRGTKEVMNIIWEDGKGIIFYNNYSDNHKLQECFWQASYKDTFFQSEYLVEEGSHYKLYFNEDTKDYAFQIISDSGKTRQLCWLPDPIEIEERTDGLVRVKSFGGNGVIGESAWFYDVKDGTRSNVFTDIVAVCESKAAELSCYTVYVRNLFGPADLQFVTGEYSEALENGGELVSVEFLDDDILKIQYTDKDRELKAEVIEL